jgi:5-formyltetrahydrofolate cyclo-ligase
VPKRELRQTIRTKLQALAPDVVQERSVDVLGRLFDQPEYTRAEIIMAFLSTPYEVDTQLLVQRSWMDLKRVCAPRVSWDQRRMMPIEITSVSNEVREDALGIREPVAGQPVPIADIDLVVLPGLAFDLQGNRLGRGRGFYDRFLSHPDYHGTSCAVAFEEQIIEEVPVGPHDVSVDMLVTDQEVRRFRRTRRA